MNLRKFWNKYKVALAFVLACLAAWPMASLAWSYVSAENNAARARWQPATVVLQRVVSGPTLHDAYGRAGTDLFVYNIVVRTGPLAGRLIKDVPLAGSYGPGSKIQLWLDKSGAVSDTNAYPRSTFDMAMPAFITGLFSALVFWGAICGLYALVMGLVFRRQVMRA